MGIHFSNSKFCCCDGKGKELKDESKSELGLDKKQWETTHKKSVQASFDTEKETPRDNLSNIPIKIGNLSFQSSFRPHPSKFHNSLSVETKHKPFNLNISEIIRQRTKSCVLFEPEITKSPEKRFSESEASSLIVSIGNSCNNSPEKTSIWDTFPKNIDWKTESDNEMGKQISLSRPDIEILDLTHPVLFPLLMLSEWSKRNILQLYYKYIRFFQPLFFLKRSMLRHLLRNSPIDGLEPIISKYFSRKNHVNILEIFSAMIIFANITYEQKAAIALYIFDFDGSKAITNDEMAILISSFARGYCCITGTRQLSTKDLNYLSNEMFKIIDRNPDGEITYEEYFLIRLVGWITLNPDIEALFAKNSPDEKIPPINLKRKLSDTVSSSKRHPSASAQVSPRRKISKTFESPSSSARASRINTQAIIKKKLFIVGSSGKKYEKDFIEKLKDYWEKGQTAESIFYIEIRKLLRADPECKYILESIESIPNNEKVLFKTILEVACPDCSRTEYNNMLGWINFKGTFYRESLEMEEAKGITRVDLHTLRRYKEVFDSVDANRDGKLDLKELEEGFSTVLKLNHHRMLFDEFDKKEKHEIDFKKFVKMISPANSRIDKEDMKYISFEISDFSYRLEEFS